MKGSDGVAGHYLSNGYLLLVGETEILPAWTVDVTDIGWGSATTRKSSSIPTCPMATRRRGQHPRADHGPDHRQ